jgi:hypothetical protein
MRVGDVDVVVANGDIGDDLELPAGVDQRPIDRIGERLTARPCRRRARSSGVDRVAG